MLSLLLFLPATVFPLLAVSKLAGRVEPSFVIAYVLLICLVTGMAYGWDKYRARSGGRRIPESVLHLLELAGGWPAQRPSTPSRNATCGWAFPPTPGTSRFS